MIPEKLQQQLQQQIEAIKFKYDIKREYFTLGIPIIIAILIVVMAFMSGHTLIEEKSAGQDTSDRQKALEELMNQMEEEESGVATTDAEEKPPEKPTSTADLDNYLVYAIIVALTPYAIDRYLKKREKKRNEEDFSQFLFKMSEMMRSGIDPIKSVIELSKTDLGSITRHVHLAASTMILGGSFEEGMRKTAASMNSELASKYIQLVVQSSYMGGQVSNLILKASEDLRSMIMIEREMEGNLKQYVMIFYFAQIILIVMVYILSAQLFPFLVGDGMKQMFGGDGIGDINYKQQFFHLLVINGLIGGVIVGKISEGSAQDGIKHSVILTLISYVACVALIFPIGGADLVTVNVAAGDGQTGIVGMPLNDPIVFQVLDAQGKPKPNTLVTVNIAPSGKLSSTMLSTDEEGNVSISIILGDETGVYKVEAKTGDTAGSASVTATTM